jgi:RNA-directed DNA polymerase
MQPAAHVTSGDPVDWHAIDGPHAYRTVKHLRHRICRASRDGDRQRVRSRQRLMLRCRAHVLESVRRVTQVNQGQDTPDVDQRLGTTPEARGRRCAPLSQLNRPRVHPVRRVYLPKRKGKRPLGIPTIVDRGVQAMVKTALEPCWEARFEGSRDGFRPGRGCHDASEQRFRVARPNTTRPWVLDADSEGALNTIGQAALVQAIGHFPARELIKPWLTAGSVADEMLHPTETGVPPGGGVSPLLLNVALHGREHTLGISYTPRGVLRGTSALGRYADDLAVLCPTRAKAIDARERLSAWLGERGLRLADEKTQMRHWRDGFNFLAFNLRHYPAPHSSRSGDKLLIQPSPDASNEVTRKLKGIGRRHVGAPTVAVINEIHPRIRGWCTYVRLGVSTAVLNDVERFRYTRAQRSRKRRHPRQSGWWRTAKSWGRTLGRQARWVFQDTQRHGTRRKLAWTKIVRHPLVPTTSSPDDPTLQDYWRQRRAKPQVTACRWRPLVQRQQGLGPICHQHLENGEGLHIHHVVPKNRGGTDDRANLWLVHPTCHRQIHSRSAPLGVRRWLEPGAR